MDPLELAHRYFDAWNAHDGAAIAATFAPAGRYSDPTESDLDGAAIGASATSLFGAFPDLRFELVSAALTGDGVVAAEWMMRGTNRGPFHALPPTGRAIALPGADFIRVGPDGIESVTGYFDGGAVPRQLGLDVIVQPREAGPFAFGTSTYATGGSDAEPGAFSLTAIEVRSEAEREEIRARSREIVQQLIGQPGFISILTASVGSRMHTITAWETEEAVKGLRRSEDHRDAIGRFFGADFATGGQTSVWRPARLNGRLVRCAACGTMVRAAATCSCGETLPAPPRFW